MLDELNETTTVPFGYFWEPNPLDPNEPTLIFISPEADLCWSLEFEQAVPLVARLSQEVAARLATHPRGKEWMVLEVEEMFQREVDKRVKEKANSYKIRQNFLQRWLGR
jgi:hypothetical protein